MCHYLTHRWMGNARPSSNSSLNCVCIEKLCKEDKQKLHWAKEVDG